MHRPAISRSECPTAMRTARVAALDLLLPAAAGERGEPAPAAAAGRTLPGVSVLRESPYGARWLLPLLQPSAPAPGARLPHAGRPVPAPPVNKEEGIVLVPSQPEHCRVVVARGVGQDAVVHPRPCVAVGEHEDGAAGGRVGQYEVL